MAHPIENISQNVAQPVIDKKDLAALWAVGLLFALILSLIGFTWEPAHYEPIPSGSVDPLEANIENGQNKMVSDALNDRKIAYDPTMQKLVRPRPSYQIFFVDLIRVLFFPTAPIVIVGLLLRKTARRSSPPPPL